MLEGETGRVVRKGWLAYQGVPFGFLEIIRSVKGIQPGLEEELGPFTVSDNNVVVHQPSLVLAEDEVGVVPLKVSIGLDDAVRRNDWLAANHQ